MSTTSESHTSTDRRHDGGPGGAGLVTAEAVELQIPTASVGLRGLALAVDLALLAVVLLAVFLGVSAVLTPAVDSIEAGTAAMWVVVVVVLSMVIVFPTAMEALTGGRSAGKALARLRVVTVEAGPVGWRHAAIRATAATFEVLATAGLVAMLVALTSPRGQRLGDMVAGTLVVREAVSRTDIRPVLFTPVAGTEELAGSLDASDLDDADYQVIRTTLLRTGLAPERHAQLCGTVARHLWPRVSRLPVPTTVPAPAVLTALAVAFQRQHAPSGQQRATDWIWDHAEQSAR